MRRGRRQYAGRAQQPSGAAIGFPVGTWEWRIVFDTYTDEMTRQTLEALCEGATLANMVWMRANPGYPCCLAEAGIQYVYPTGCTSGGAGPCQTVRGAAEILRSGVATCIDIASYYAASLRLRGTAARVIVQNMVDAGGNPIPGQYHILVRTRGGVRDYTEDLIAGFHPRCATDCQRPIVKRAAGAKW